MNESARYVRWETPVSDAYVLMVKLCRHDGDLDITLDCSSITEARDDIQFKFKKCPAFRSILEKFRTKLCLPADEYLGRTFIVENSPWIAELEVSEPIFSNLSKNVRHYVIAGDWEVVEILSTDLPIIVHQQR
jgi:hypothetical protein